VTRTIRILTMGLALGVAAHAAAQTKADPAKKGAAPAPAPPAAAAPAAPAPAQKVDLPSPPPNFEYSPEGRRDPFLSLVQRGTEAKSNSAAGLPGMMTAEITVRGILLKAGNYVAMVSGPDGKVFTARAGDKLADGVIRNITANSVVILQEVNDPLSLEKQREVRKFLRSGEEV
jgi:Tfp pilus assembly protein PilP